MVRGGVCVQPPTYADDVALLAFARRMPQLQREIDISCRTGPQQQTYSCAFAPVAVGPCWDRQTDGQVDGHRAVS